MIATRSFPSLRSLANQMADKAISVLLAWRARIAMLITCLLVASFSVGSSLASGVTLDVDPAPIIEGANSYIPMWMNILAVPAGLAIGFAITSLVVGSIVLAIQKARSGF